MRRRRYATRKEVLILPKVRIRKPGRHGFASVLCDLELNRARSLPLHHDGPRRDRARRSNVVHLQRDEIAPAQLAVDGQV
jgi:hypothetical protein